MITQMHADSDGTVHAEQSQADSGPGRIDFRPTERQPEGWVSLI